MAVCKFNPTMAEQKRNECRDLIIPSFPPPRNSSRVPLTFFFSIAVADYSKIRIKIPKVLVKAVLRKGNKNNTGDGGDQGKTKKRNRKRKLGKLKRIIPNKVCSLLSSVFRGGKSREGRYMDEWRVGKKGKKFKEFHPMKQEFEGKNNGGEGSDGMVVVVKQGTSGRLSWVPLRTWLSYRKVKKGPSLMRRNWVDFKQINGGETEEEEEEEEYELCKRRILMGGRCRPLNQSGFLQYDKDGILVPDILW